MLINPGRANGPLHPLKWCPTLQLYYTVNVWLMINKLSRKAARRTVKNSKISKLFFQIRLKFFKKCQWFRVQRNQKNIGKQLSSNKCTVLKNYYNSTISDELFRKFEKKFIQPLVGKLENQYFYTIIVDVGWIYSNFMYCRTVHCEHGKHAGWLWSKLTWGLLVEKYQL